MKEKIQKFFMSGLIFLLLITVMVILVHTFVFDETINAMVIAIILAGICIAISFQNYRNSRELTQLAYVDSLTGGNNLNKFKMLAKKLLAHNKEQLYMVRIDVDNFKLINDMYGYKDGDRILLLMNKLIAKLLSKNDVYGRVANDNFICLISGSSDEEILELGQMFRMQFKENLEKRGYHYTVNFTTGVHKVTDGEMDVDKLIDRATMAHRKAKNLASERKFVFYSDDIRKEALKEQDIENAMHEALSKEEFIVFYQPKYNLKTRRIEGTEALVRWFHDGMILPPSYFLPTFERNGFIASIDLFMFEKVCQMQRKWMDMGIDPVPVSVNQSKALIYTQDYVERLSGIAKKYNVPPKLLELELLEGLVHENIEELKKIVDRLHAAGFAMSIDDFGSGYSSLNLLKDIQADVLKIDKVFLDNAEENIRAEVILKNIVGMAADLRIWVVVEGVETEKQSELVKKIGAQTAQGYLYAKPMPEKEYEDMLIEKEKSPAI